MKELLSIASRHPSETLSAATVLLTAVYAVLTFFILRANQRIVASMQIQSQQERQLRNREHFLAGIATIAQYDIDSPACEQAMRLLDYYSSLALSQNDPALYSILNTVMTAEIRKKLEDIQEQGKEIYPDAVAARTHIQKTLRDYHLQRKGIKPK